MTDLADMFWPRVCRGCGKALLRREEQLCIHCFVKLPRASLVQGTEHSLQKLFRGRIELYQADAWLFFRKKGISQQMMHVLKYHGDKDLGTYLGRMYGKELKSRRDFILPGLITSVPLHHSKLRRRGFNQSDLIAAGMAESLGIPFRPDLLIRLEDKASQTGKKRYERWENADDTYQVGQNRMDLPRHIALVDDVITTGATLEACAAKLKAAGVPEISVFAICIAIN